MSPRRARLRSAIAGVMRAYGGRHNIIGYVDHIDSGMIRGWAFDALLPLSRLPLDVFYRGIFLGTARTGGFRQDLRDRNVGDGHHGFVFHLPPDTVDEVSAEDIDVIASFPAPVPLTVMGQTVGDRTVALDQVRLRATPSSFFVPLIDRLASTKTPPNERAEGDRAARIDPLLASSSPDDCSAFARHIATKHDRPDPSLDPQVFWQWYLNVYCAFKPNLRPPLSKDDISRIDALLLDARSSDRDGSDERIATLDPTVPRTYGWAAMEARRLGIEDCLIDETTRRDLASVPWLSKAEAFPLSRFMRILRANHHILRPLGRSTVAGRQAIYTLVMLLAIREPHYLRFIPREWLGRMLEDDGSGIPFERAQARLFDGRFLSKQQFEAHQSRTGFDIAEGGLSGTAYHGHRIEGGSTIVGGRPVDVQLIGPFRRSLGLAESCRRLAAALSRIPHTVNFVDYDLGFSSAVAEPEVDLGPVKAARINILHLNAEEIPEAIALMPDAFSKSHVIAVPYWELNRPSDVHTLGLKLIDEIWATSHYLESVFAGAGVRTSHIGICIDDRFAISKDRGRSFLRSLGVGHAGATILTTADALSWTQRKNLVGSITAFETAFPTDDDVRLIVKTRNADKALSTAQKLDWDEIVRRCAADPRIVLIDSTLGDRDHKAMLAGADCLLSLHRAEGLGLDILDALHIGTPVVATAYSGNMDYCDADTAWLVDFTLKPVAPDEYVFVEKGHVWAEPDIGSAARALRSAIRDLAEAKRKSAVGQKQVHAIASLDAFAGRLCALVANRVAKTTEKDSERRSASAG